MAKVAEIRSSQLVNQFGPGSLYDEHAVSIIISGIDDWDISSSEIITEPRLRKVLRRNTFYGLPRTGAPARVFPEYLFCSRCRRLDHYSYFKRSKQRSAFSSSIEFTCDSCPANVAGESKAPALAFPARFMTACTKGHLDDFPWKSWAHNGETSCNANLEFRDTGYTGSLADLRVKCKNCGKQNSLDAALGDKTDLLCSGRRPWLNDTDPHTCSEKARVLLRGASNAYFPDAISSLSIPPYSTPLHDDIFKIYPRLQGIQGLEDLKAAIRLKIIPELDFYTPAVVWEALKQLRELEDEMEASEHEALMLGEYKALVSPVNDTPDFKTRKLPTKKLRDFASIFSRFHSVTKVLRLREVRVLKGFTRIEASSAPDKLASLSSIKQDWLPAVELRGEGIFFELSQKALQLWENQKAVQEYSSNLPQMDLTNAFGGPAEISSRFVLAHSISHMLMQAIQFEAGYSTVSLRERIYCNADIAGILIYTSSPSSDGTLGGLVELTDVVGGIFARALEGARLCTNDPYCSSHNFEHPTSHYNGAACHACLLLPETCCEYRNRFLDRSSLVEILSSSVKRSIAYDPK